MTTVGGVAAVGFWAPELPQAASSATAAKGARRRVCFIVMDWTFSKDQNAIS